jgi:hypothetical protein
MTTWAPTASDLLDLWDRGQGRPPPEQALLLAAYAAPADVEPATLSIGRRNALLLELRRRSFGEALRCRAGCPACGEQLEFAVSADDLLAGAPPQAEDSFEAGVGAITATMRLPNGDDLLAAAGCADAAEARRLLLRRCIARASVAGDPLDVDALPEDVIAALAAEAAARDPLAELLLDMACPACGAAWQAPLDIAAFLWRELTVQAERLLHDVHLLARGYGWAEDAILAMSARRRRRYLELIEGD